MEPILVPAWPSVLRAGLPCITPKGPTIYIAAGPMLIGVIPSAWSAPSLLSAYTTEDLVWLRPDEWRLDLRDPAVRDAVVRAMWRKRRPGEPEPLTAPYFARGHSIRGASYWYIEHPDGTPAYRLAVSEIIGDGIACLPVPALASIPLDSPDRDLLALAACAAAVLGGA